MGRGARQTSEVSIMWIQIDIVCLYYAYIYVMKGNSEGYIILVKAVRFVAC